MKSLILFAVATSLVASQAFAAAGSKRPSAKLPTKLPKAVKKKKAKVNFEENSGTHITTVIVRTPLPLEKALEDQKQAANEVTVISSSKTVSLPELTDAMAPEAAAEKQPPRYHVLPEVLPEVDSEPSRLRRIFIDETLLVNAAAPDDSAPATPVAAPDEATAAPTSTAELMGPQAPAPATAAVVAEPAEAAAPAPDLSLSAGFSARPADRINRFYLRSSFLNARYSEIDSHLENGAHGIAIGWARQSGNIEGRASLEFGYGKGQDMTVQNTRYLIARGDALYFFRSNVVRPYTGIGLGVGSFDVRVQRPAVNPNDLLYHEYAKGSAAIVSPSTGIRFDLTGFAVDVGIEYLVVIGAGTTSALGGWAGALTLSFPF